MQGVLHEVGVRVYRRGAPGHGVHRDVAATVFLGHCHHYRALSRGFQVKCCSIVSAEGQPHNVATVVLHNLHAGQFNLNSHLNHQQHIRRDVCTPNALHLPVRGVCIAPLVMPKPSCKHKGMLAVRAS